MKRTMKMILTGIMLLAVFLSPIHVEAADTHSHYEKTISPGASWYMYGYRSEDRGVYGSFSTTSNDITFYLVDSANFAKWENHIAFDRYKILSDVYSGSYSFRIPYDDTWYFIFDNRDSYFSTTNLVFDSYVDTTAPTITASLSAGAFYSGIKTIEVTAQDAKFSVESTKLYIDSVLMRTEYDGSLSYNWDTEDYSNGQHTIRVTVSDNVLNSDSLEYIVNVDNPIITTSGTTGSNPPYVPNAPASGPSAVIPLALGLVGAVALIGIGAMVFNKRNKEGSPIIPVSRPPPPSDETISYSAQQMPADIVKIACPFCGSKIDKSLTKCSVCGAEL